VPEIVHIAAVRPGGTVEVARVYFLLGHRLRFDWLRDTAQRVVDEDPWHKAAADAFSQDLAAHQGAITRAVLTAGAGDRSPQELTDAWLASQASRVEPVDRLLAELTAAPTIDFAMLTVANHQLRLLAGG